MLIYASQFMTSQIILLPLFRDFYILESWGYYIYCFAAMFWHYLE